MYERVKAAIKQLQDAMKIEGVDPTKGLPEELFILSTTLVPIVNIDLFVTNEHHQLLLAWRDDIYHGQGWHIPGGCVRLRERLKTRVVLTAEKELGVPIEYNPEPIAVREIIESENRPGLERQLERCHNISFLFDCTVKQGYVVPRIVDGVALRWFDSLPDEILKTHIDQYGDIIENHFNNKCGGARK